VENALILATYFSFSWKKTQQKHNQISKQSTSLLTSQLSFPFLFSPRYTVPAEIWKNDFDLITKFIV
jgi:hypothetical protein